MEKLLYWMVFIALIRERFLLSKGAHYYFKILFLFLNARRPFFFLSLVHEREAQLFDGSRILRHDRYDDLQKHLNCSDETMAEKKLLKVHKDFRIVALAEPPNSTGMIIQ